MDLKEQKYVCTLAECKSLTRASERLYISQPALSLYINNVEKILGARLFERNGRKFELTWLGKQYVEKASQMLELERQFELLDLMVTQPHIDHLALRGLRMPVLVVAGDHDMIYEAHTRMIAAPIPHGKLAILPGDHFVARDNWKEFNPLVLDFLQKD